MAMEVMKLATKMVLKLDGGVDENGKQVVLSKSYANVNTLATDQDIYDVGSALSALQTSPLEGIHRVEETVLVQV